MKTFIVLLNWNGWRDTVSCLSSLFADDSGEFSVVVCDAFSHDESVTQLAAWGRRFLGDRYVELRRSDVDSGAHAPPTARMVLIENGANLGFAAGNNIGIRLALRDPDCRYVWVLNNDTVVRRGALQRALEHMEANPQIGLCGSTLLYLDEPDKVQAFGGAVYSRWTGRSRHIGAFESAAQIPRDGRSIEAGMSYVLGASMLVRRTFLERVGLMREDYFLYYEEIDWAMRGAKASFKLGYAPASVVLHKEGASIGTRASGGSTLSMYYLFRNRLRFSWRFYPRCTLSVLGFGLLDVAKLAARRRWPQARAALRGLLQFPWRRGSSGPIS